MNFIFNMGLEGTQHLVVSISIDFNGELKPSVSHKRCSTPGRGGPRPWIAFIDLFRMFTRWNLKCTQIFMTDCFMLSVGKASAPIGF